MPTVRTTMRPDQPIEVGEAEYLDLQRQGLLVEPPEPPAVMPVTKKAVPSATSKEG
ncbi:hypothetical protein ABZ419_11515 [Streptomyces cinnamoneus]|uniref:hypothetical protein n=1 Tax=Streptomyces cinnamoneus TaxID=53446 RepID=UPI0033C4B823